METPNTRLVDGQREYRCSECRRWSDQVKLVEGQLLCGIHWEERRREMISEKGKVLAEKGRKLVEVVRNLRRQFGEENGNGKGKKETGRYTINLMLRSSTWADQMVSVGFVAENRADADLIMAARDVLGMEVIGYSVQIGE